MSKEQCRPDELCHCHKCLIERATKLMEVAWSVLSARNAGFVLIALRDDGFGQVDVEYMSGGLLTPKETMRGLAQVTIEIGKELGVSVDLQEKFPQQSGATLQ